MDRYTPLLDAAGLKARRDPEYPAEVLELAVRIEELYAGREREALELILRTVRRAHRSVRLAKPTPREGVEALLDLVEAIAAGALGHEVAR